MSKGNTGVLVTGGAGFIGSHVVDRVLETGLAVSVLDNLSSGTRENLRSSAVPAHEVDLRSPEVAAVLGTEPPEVVLHLAGQVDVRISVADPVRDADVNILGTLNLLEAARAAGVRKVVVAS